MHRLYILAVIPILYTAGKIAYYGYLGIPLNSLMTISATASVASLACWAVVLASGERM